MSIASIVLLSIAVGVTFYFYRKENPKVERTLSSRNSFDSERAMLWAQRQDRGRNAVECVKKSEKLFDAAVAKARTDKVPVASALKSLIASRRTEFTYGTVERSVIRDVLKVAVGSSSLLVAYDAVELTLNPDVLEQAPQTAA